MNLKLFKSVHAVVAAVVVGGFLAWWTLGSGHFGDAIQLGRGEGSSPNFLLWTGWVAFALYVILVLYAWRKHAHRRGLTPEFKMEVPIEKLESAQRRLNALRVEIAAGRLRGKGEIEQAAQKALREEGVAKIIRAQAAKGPEGGPPFVLTVANREPLGRLAKWMHAHIYYGLAAALLVWLHGGGTFVSPMGILLNGLSYLVIITGFVGIVLWVFGPAWLTRKERDLSIEKAFALREHFRRKVAESEKEFEVALVESGRPADGAVQRQLHKLGRSRRRFAPRARAFLDELPKDYKQFSDHVEDILVLMGQRLNVESTWGELSRVRFCLNVWRAVHVPASILLMAIVVVHIISVIWY